MVRTTLYIPMRIWRFLSFFRLDCAWICTVAPRSCEGCVQGRFQNSDNKSTKSLLKTLNGNIVLHPPSLFASTLHPSLTHGHRQAHTPLNHLLDSPLKTDPSSSITLYYTQISRIDICLGGFMSSLDIQMFSSRFEIELDPALDSNHEHNTSVDKKYFWLKISFLLMPSHVFPDVLLFNHPCDGRTRWCRISCL